MNNPSLYPHEILVKYLKDPSPTNFIILQVIVSLLVPTFVIIFIAIVDPNTISQTFVPWINLGLNLAYDLTIVNTVIGIISTFQVVMEIKP